jgi:integrase
MRKPYYWKERKCWYFRFHDEDGKLRGMPLRGTSKKDAYEHWKELTAPPDEAVDTVAELAVVDLINQFWGVLKNRVRLKQIEPATLERRESSLLSFVASIDRNLGVSGLKPLHVTAWLDSQPRWNATSRYHAVKAIKAAFKWATDEGHIVKNPLSNFSVQTGESRDFVISRSTYRKLIVGASDLKFRRRHVTAFKSFLIALHLTGCRPGEVAKVQIEDFDGESWTIAKHKTKRKKKQPRVVYLGPCAQTLSRILAHGRKHGPLFRPHQSRPWKYSDARRRFGRLRDRIDIEKDCVMYSFRHTWITNAMVATGDVAAVAEMAGTSIKMIQDHYGHLSQRRSFLMESAGKIAQACHPEN